MTYSMHESFILPSNCLQTQTSRCSVNLLFWYDRRKYTVTFPSESTHDHNIGDNRHFIMIEIATNQFFSHDIHHVCKETDDCAITFAQQQIALMTKRTYNIQNLYSDLRQLLYDNSTLSTNLACFDMNDVVRQCTVPGISGSCHIVDDIIKHKFHKRFCLQSDRTSVSVNIFDSGHFAFITLKCNRLLCNGPLTMVAVKRILQHHNISDVNGRLPGSSTHLSITRFPLILTVFLCFLLK